MSYTKYADLKGIHWERLSNTLSRVKNEKLRYDIEDIVEDIGRQAFDDGYDDGYADGLDDQ